MYIFFSVLLFFIMMRRHPSSTRSYTLFPYTTPFRSQVGDDGAHVAVRHAAVEGDRHDRADHRAVGPPPLADGGDDLGVAPAADAGLDVGRQVGAVGGEIGRAHV